MHAYAVIGGDAQEREKETEALLLSWQVSPFDRVVLKREEDEQSIGITQVNDWRSGLYFAPVSSPRRAGIIREADTLTPEAQNAILKILEEPPVHLGFILTAGSDERLLPTVKSRLIIKRLKSASPDGAVTAGVMSDLEKLNEAGSAGELVSRIDQIVADRDRLAVLEWLTVAISCVRARRETGDTALLRRLMICCDMVRANVNPKSALTTAFLPENSMDKRAREM